MTDDLPRTQLLRTEHLTRHFKIGGALSRRTLHAVDDVSFTIGEREIVALAGESGSGKSTIARVLARIYKPTSGEVFFEGKPLSSVTSRPDRLRYSALVPMVFQDPFGQIAEAGPIEDVLTHPRHPYIQLLLSAVPDPRAPLSVAAETDRGEPPRVIDPGPGCRFRWRCPLAIDKCAQVTPELAELTPAHDAACHVAQTSPEEIKAFTS